MAVYGDEQLNAQVARYALASESCSRGQLTLEARRRGNHLPARASCQRVQVRLARFSLIVIMIMSSRLHSRGKQRAVKRERRTLAEALTCTLASIHLCDGFTFIWRALHLAVAR